MITGFYAAILALIQIKLTFNIVKIRKAHMISIGDDGREDLARSIRVHGNFIETVPIVLILILVAELGGAPFWAIHGLGAAMVGARVSHAIGLGSGTGHGKFRLYGMVMTVNVIVAGALLNLYLSIIQML